MLLVKHGPGYWEGAARDSHVCNTDVLRFVGDFLYKKKLEGANLLIYVHFTNIYNAFIRYPALLYILRTQGCMRKKRPPCRMGRQMMLCDINRKSPVGLNAMQNTQTVGTNLITGWLL